jgi:hypothetical protein
VAPRHQRIAAGVQARRGGQHRHGAARGLGTRARLAGEGASLAARGGERVGIRLAVHIGDSGADHDGHADAYADRDHGS